MSEPEEPKPDPPAQKLVPEPEKPAELGKTEEKEEKKSLFSDWKVFISGTAKDEVLKALEENGATIKSYLSSQVTHCLAGNEPDVEGDLSEAVDIHEIPVLRQEYIVDLLRNLADLDLKAREKVIKGYSAAPNRLFSASVFDLKHISNERDKNALFATVTFHGGKVSGNDPTHTVSCHCDPLLDGVANLVTPDFIIESIRSGKLLQESLFHPKLILKPGEKVRKIRKKRPKPPTPPQQQSMAIMATTTNRTPVVSTPPIPATATPSSTSVVTMTTTITSQSAETPQITTTTTVVSRANASSSAPATAADAPISTTPSLLAPVSTTIANPTTVATTTCASAPVSTPSSAPTSATAPVTSEQQPQQLQGTPQQQVPQQQQPTSQPPPPPQQQQQQQINQAPPVSAAPHQMTQQQQQPQMNPSQQPQQINPVQQPQQQMNPGQQQQMNPGQQQQMNPGQQQHWQQQQQGQWQQQGQINQQGQYRQQMMSGQQQPQQQWQQQQQQPPQQPMMRPRIPSPHMLKQQQILQQHIQTLTPEQRENFQRMTPRDKQTYLASRGLLLPNPQQQQQQIPLTEQQKEALNNMDPSQRQGYLQTIQREHQMRMMQQQQVRMPNTSQANQQQWQQQQQQQQQQVPIPHSSPNGPRAPMGQQQQRPAWSGETHPALAQVPRTPQQQQHLQRLQMQREQQQMDPNNSGAMMGPRNPGQGPLQQQPSPQQQQQQMLGQPQVQMGPQQQQQQQFMNQQQQQANGSNQQKTKAALQNMLTNRGMQQPGPGATGPPIQGNMVVQQQPQQQQQQPPQQQMPPSTPPQMPPDGSAATRLQMMNQQLQQQQQQHMMPGPPPPGAMYPPQQRPPHQYMQMQQQRMEMSPRGFPSPRMMPPGSPQTGMRPGMAPGPPQPRIQFHGHDPSTRLPPDLCLLGCIFHIIDYQDDSDLSCHVNNWKKVIKQFGGEVEEDFTPRITHLMCKSQSNPICQQAIRAGKRLITAYWLNDIVLRKKVLPPWKAVHFPLPSNFSPPCENYLIAMTGFEGRDRDWIRDMIKLIGAKYTGCFSKHNHVLVCAQNALNGNKFLKAKEWKVAYVSVQWLNDVIFNGQANAEQCMHNPKYQNLTKVDTNDQFRIDYSLVPHLMNAWKEPIRVTPETYQKFKENPPARIKRKAEQQRMEKEAKRLKEAEMANGGSTNTNNMNGDQPPQQQQQQQQQSSVVTGINPETGEPTMEVKTENNDNNNSQEKKTEGATIKKLENPPKVLFTGFTPSKLEEMSSIVDDLGGQIVPSNQVKQATHLVMPKMGRTLTLLSAIPYIRFALSDEWLRRSKEEGKFLEETQFPLRGEAFEKQHGVTIGKVIKRANRSKLFEGKFFYLTPNIRPHWKKLKEVIEHSGGVVQNHRRRTVNQVRVANKRGADPNYIVITCEQDIYLVNDLLKNKLAVYNVELVLSAILNGFIDFDLSKSLITV